MDDKELNEVLVEFALKAHDLIQAGKFFDKDSKPQEGTSLISEVVATIEADKQRAVREEMEEVGKYIGRRLAQLSKEDVNE